MLLRLHRPGAYVEYDDALDYPVVDAQDEAEFRWHIHSAEKAGLLERPGGTANLSLSMKGWDYLIGPSGGGAVPGRCFVAMSFSDEHAAIYTEGIEPAVHDAGYSAVWMKSVLTNEDINYRMVLEIRRSQFVVADLTGLKGGVYFEGGFAMGLGRPVFWTTHADEMQRIHFDTNHYQHTVWKTHEELRAKLAEKIEAILGPGSNKMRAVG